MEGTCVFIVWLGVVLDPTAGYVGITNIREGSLALTYRSVIGDRCDPQRKVGSEHIMIGMRGIKRASDRGMLLVRNKSRP